MFVAEALYNFSKASLAPKQQEQPLYKTEKKEAQQQEKTLKRAREEDHQQQLAREGGDKFYNKNAEQTKGREEKPADKDGKKDEQIAYLAMEKGDKILVEQAYENGWWFGHAIKRPTQKGFFPSNYVKAGAKPPPPAPPKHKPQEQQEYEQDDDADADADEVGDKLQQLGALQAGPVTSDYYQGITRYKYVKINDNNKNILNGSYVKFDAATGLARVPVKDQAPAAKAVRQMGYYFDYHQWNEEKNKNPEAFKGRPDPKKKKAKKLRLLGMGKDA